MSTNRLLTKDEIVRVKKDMKVIAGFIGIIKFFMAQEESAVSIDTVNTSMSQVKKVVAKYPLVLDPEKNK